MKKTVVIVDDDDEATRLTKNALMRRGFRVESAGTVAAADELIEQLGEEIDVMVLDMRLMDPDAPTATGVDIAIRVRDRHPDWMPEYMIKTAFPIDYYRLALALGVAAYLNRGEVTEAEVYQHIRALALKRSLRVERASVMSALTAISDSTKNLFAAVTKFCRLILAEELNACVGTPYVLLLSDERDTRNVATNTDLPVGSGSYYAAMQEMAHGITKLSSQYVFSVDDTKHLPPAANEVDEKVFARLPGAALLPLAKIMNFRLSLALFTVLPGESRYAEETGAFAEVLAQHVRPSIVERFLEILVQLDAQKRAMLRSTAHFCLYVGQEQQGIIDRAKVRGELQEETNLHQALITMAEDLRRTGTILNSATSRVPEQSTSILKMEDVARKEVADLKDLAESHGVALSVEGDCRVRAGDDLSIAVKRLLEWFVQRAAETPPDVSPAISVRCVENENDSQIILEDHSRRLPSQVRQHLFEPFSTSVSNVLGANRSGPGIYLPLYLAKVLVEDKYGGRLSDESHSMNGNNGHRLVMSFSAPGNSAIGNETKGC